MSDKPWVDQVKDILRSSDDFGDYSDYLKRWTAQNIAEFRRAVKHLTCDYDRLKDELQSVKNWRTACEEQVTADSEQIKTLLDANAALESDNYNKELNLQELTAALAKAEKRAEAAVADMEFLVHQMNDTVNGNIPCHKCSLYPSCHRLASCPAHGYSHFDWNDPTE